MAEPDLTVTVGADTRPLKQGLGAAGEDVKKFGEKTEKESQKTTKSFTDMVNSVVGRLAILGGALGAVTIAISDVQKAVQRATAVGDLADRMRITAEQASGLAHVIEATGLDLDKFSQAVRTLEQNLAKGVGNAMSDVSLLFREMGIDMEDAGGRVRDFASLLPELADQFENWNDEARKGAIAAQLFGNQAGPKMAELLSQGRAGLEEAIREAQRFGLVTTDQVQNARDYEKSTKALQAAVNQLSYEFGSRLAPAITSVVNGLTALMQLIPRANADLAGMSTEQLQSEANKAMLKIGELTTQLQDLQARASRGEFVEDLFNPLNSDLKVLEERIRVIQGLMGSGPGPRPAPPPPVNTPDLEGIRKRYAEAQFQLDQFVERLTGVRLIFDELNTAALSHAEIMAQVTQKVNAAYADQGEARRRLAQIEKALNKQNQDNMLATASMAASLITQLFPKSKAAGVAAAVINTAVGITNALRTGLYPWNYIQAGLIAASGAAQIATIQSTTPGGGPTPSVGGGTAGAGTGPEQGTASRMLTISGLQEEGRYSGSSVIGLIDQINEEVKNGAVLISTSSTRQQAA